MSKVNSERVGCVDVYHASLLTNASFAGRYEFPILCGEHEVPKRMIPFSAAMRERMIFISGSASMKMISFSKGFGDNQTGMLISWANLMELFPQISAYTTICHMLCRFGMYLEVEQSGLGFSNKVSKSSPIYGSAMRTFDCCCDGIPKHSVISIGTLGYLKVKEYRSTFEEGVIHVAKLLEPETIIFYGAAPNSIPEIRKLGINVIIIKPKSFYKNVEVKR